MYEFTSEGYFHIRDRLCLAIKERWDGTGEFFWTPACLRDQIVKVDDKEWKVLAVEMFMIYASRNQPYRSNFALLVEEP